MTISLESHILLWIEEELATEDAAAVLPVQLLMLRMVLLSREADEQLTQSVELSLSAFDRATLYRLLRQLERRRFIQFVDAQGSPMALDESLSDPEASVSAREPASVSLSATGRGEVLRLKRLLTPVVDR